MGNSQLQRLQLYIYTLSSLWTPTVITKNANNKIGIYDSHYPSIFHEFNTISPKFTKEQILGNWIEYERLSQVPLPSMHLKSDTLQRIKITHDKIYSKRFNREKKLNWQLTNDGGAIFFTNWNFKYNYIWTIESVTDSTLIIEIPSSRLNESITIKYRRQ